MWICQGHKHSTCISVWTAIRSSQSRWVTLVSCWSKGRCSRENCKYLHPPAHLKTQLEINGRNNLIQQKTAAAMLAQQMQLMLPGPSLQPVVSEDAAASQKHDRDYFLCGLQRCDPSLPLPHPLSSAPLSSAGTRHQPRPLLRLLHDATEPRDEPRTHGEPPQRSCAGPGEPGHGSAEFFLILLILLLFSLTESAASGQTWGISMREPLTTFFHSFCT